MEATLLDLAPPKKALRMPDHLDRFFIPMNTDMSLPRGKIAEVLPGSFMMRHFGENK
jgi:hypothetical protein